MVLGNMLLERNNQYVASRDPHGTWRVLNTWHQELKGLSADADIGDDHPAVTLVTEGAFLALIKEATSLGALSGSVESEEGISFEEHEIVCKERDDLKIKLELVQTENMPSSEVLKIAEGKIALIGKLAGLNQLDESVVQLILQIGGNEDIK